MAKGGGPGRHMAKPMEKPKNLKATVIFIWAYLKNKKVLLALAGLMVIINMGGALAGTAVLQPIIDNFLDPIKGNPTIEERFAGLARGIGLLGLIYVATVFGAYFQNRIMVHIAQKSINELRKDLFNHLQKLPLRYYDTRTHGEVMSRFSNDVDTLQDAVSNSLTSLFSSVITLAGIILLMVTRSALLTILTLLMTPLMFTVARKLMKAGSKHFKAQQKSLGEVNGYAEEIITGQKIVKVFCYEEKAQEKFDELNKQLQAAATKAQSYGGLMMPVMMNLNSINYALVTVIGGIMTIQGNLSVGALVVFLQLTRQFGRPINEASSQFNSLITAIAGAERIHEMMKEKEEEKDPENAVNMPENGVVRFDHVTFGYVEEKTVLNDLSLYAKPGQKIAFVGSTGAGKTTIINLLTRFYDIDQGSITIEGIDIRDMKKDSLRHGISVVLQDTHLFTGTVRENIRYGRLDATDEEVENAANLASAHSFICRLPRGYDTLIEGDGANLSQGQRQLLNIARAAVANAPILILDEATSSVDTRTEKQIEKGLDRLMQGRTTFIIAHRLSTVRNANAIMVMEQGKIIERGTHEELLKLKGRYYQLYHGIVELD